MKKIIYMLCLVFVLLPKTNFAQEEKVADQQSHLKYIYLNIGKGVADGNLFGLGLNFIYLKNWGFSMSYNNLATVPDGLPAKYDKRDITNNLNSFSFRILREFSTKTKLIRFGIEAGPSFINYKLADLGSTIASSNNNSNSGSNSGFLSGGLFGGGIFNYGNFYSSGTSSYSGSRSNNSDKFKQQTLGLSLRAKLEFPLTRIIGIELAANSNINKIHSYVGGEIHLTIGLVRGKIK